LVPTNADVPHIDVEFLNIPDTTFNSLGVRGIGEIGIAGVPAAIANAIFNATGTRVRDLPITPESLLVEQKGMA
jgi:xanthine dehydrogenase YagR molybdenum-binding subunit